MGLWSRLKSAVDTASTSSAHPDERFGTGLWRQHRDRFTRAVDRFYATAVDLRRDADSNNDAGDHTAETIAQQTVVLNSLADRIDAIAARCHAEYPVAGLVIPATSRAQFGQLPELLSKAAAKVAEACQAAAMARVAVRTGTDPEQAAAAARSYVTDAAELVTRCEELVKHE